MKALNSIIARIGLDRFAHLGIGGLMCAIVSDILILASGVICWRSLLCGIIACTVVFAVSVLKEYCIDEKADWADIAAAMAGCALYMAALTAGIALWTA